MPQPPFYGCFDRFLQLYTFLEITYNYFLDSKFCYLHCVGTYVDTYMTLTVIVVVMACRAKTWPHYIYFSHQATHLVVLGVINIKTSIYVGYR